MEDENIKEYLCNDNVREKPLPTYRVILQHQSFWRQELPTTFIDFIKRYNGCKV